MTHKDFIIDPGSVHLFFLIPQLCPQAYLFHLDVNWLHQPQILHPHSKRTTKTHIFSWCLLFTVITIFPGASWQAFLWLESHHMSISFSIMRKMNRCLKLTSINLPLVDRVNFCSFNKTMLLCGHGRSGSREQQCLPQFP